MWPSSIAWFVGAFLVGSLVFTVSARLYVAVLLAIGRRRSGRWTLFAGLAVYMAYAVFLAAIIFAPFCPAADLLQSPSSDEIRAATFGALLLAGPVLHYFAIRRRINGLRRCGMFLC